MAKAEKKYKARVVNPVLYPAIGPLCGRYSPSR